MHTWIWTVYPILPVKSSQTPLDLDKKHFHVYPQMFPRRLSLVQPLNVFQENSPTATATFLWLGASGHYRAKQWKVALLSDCDQKGQNFKCITITGPFYCTSGTCITFKFVDESSILTVSVCSKDKMLHGWLSEKRKWGGRRGVLQRDGEQLQAAVRNK